MKILSNLLFLLFSVLYYGQNDTSVIIKHTENDYVIPKSEKIVYRGLPNEVLIEVPNSKSFDVEGLGVSKKEKNIFLINPSFGKEVIITISGILKNGKKFSKKINFEIRNIQNIQAKINNLDNDDQFRVKLQRRNLLNAIIKSCFTDKNLGIKSEIKSFEIKIPNYNSILIYGNRIKESDYNKFINRVKIGDEIVISNIRFTTNSNANFCKINPIIIQIY
ncbi:GldM family protein [Flavobacterium sp.]|uniref:GldM family protein n=1 Tax=Flavobacterium sp. TaxID=239 RepID=UPI002B4B4E2D|nr:GldM family protein [Flavobacterium sp.]HLP63299.1 GldM family protein [Flavobacterium sp.]